MVFPFSVKSTEYAWYLQFLVVCTCKTSIPYRKSKCRFSDHSGFVCFYRMMVLRDRGQSSIRAAGTTATHLSKWNATLRKIHSKLLSMFITYTFILFTLPSELELAAPAADVVEPRALKVFVFKNLHRCKAGIHFSLVANT